MEIKGVMHHIEEDLATECRSSICQCDENCPWFEEVLDWDTFEKWFTHWS